MKKLLLVSLVIFIFHIVSAQNAGDNDPTFNPTDIGFGFGVGAGGDVHTISIQPDGKIIIGGYISNYNLTPIFHLARLNVDGSIDNSFNVNTGVNGTIESVATQTDGKILIGGWFWEFDGSSKNKLARLNPNGSLDTTFDIGSGFDNAVQSISIQDDGKIIIGGLFNSYNGQSKSKIVRLNIDGTLDTTFNIGSGFGGSDEVITTEIQPDGKILVGGNIWSYNGTPTYHIVRLNNDGSLDSSFNTGTGTSMGPEVNTIALQPDGKIIIGGKFTSYNGVSRNKIARLNANGTLDSSFNIGSGFGTGSSTSINSIGLQADGKIIVVGFFTSYSGTNRNRLIRLNPTGSIDATFNIGTGTGSPSEIYTTSIQSDGKIIIGGQFQLYNGIGRKNITRLNTNGTLDNSFNGGTGVNGNLKTASIFSNDKILIGGYFYSFNGENRNNIARLNSDGTIDPSFIVGTGTNESVISSVIQPDNKIIVGGSFTSYNGYNINRLIRLKYDGSIDSSFSIGTGLDGDVLATALQDDGKIIIGGLFDTYDGNSLNALARLNVDGSLDTTFNIGTGVNNNNNIYDVAIQSDGKIIVVGDFTSFNGTFKNRIVRLNSDGSIDTTFNIGVAANNQILTLAIQPNGKIIIGGDFTSFNGTSCKYIVRLDTNGAVDTSFNTSNGPNSTVLKILVQSNNRILIGGFFTTIDGISRNRFTRLLSDGTLDVSFDVGSGVNFVGTTMNQSISTIALQDDDKIIIGGYFIEYDSVGRNCIARVLNCGVNSSFSFTDNNNGNYSFTNTSTGSYTHVYWQFGDGTTSTLLSPNHNFIANGNFPVVLTLYDSIGSCFDYHIDTIVVTGVPSPLQCAAGFVMYPDTGDVTVVNSSIGTNLTYLWDFGDGNTSTQQFPNHTYATLGNYYLCLTVDDGAGCVDMYCDSIGENGVVFKGAGFTINVTAPPIVTGVNNEVELSSGIRIYPNPTSTQLTIDTQLNIDKLSVTNITGKTITSISLKSNVIDVSSLADGIYFIKIEGEGQTITEKFIKN